MIHSPGLRENIFQVHRPMQPGYHPDQVAPRMGDPPCHGSGAGKVADSPWKFFGATADIFRCKGVPRVAMARSGISFEYEKLSLNEKKIG